MCVYVAGGERGKGEGRRCSRARVQSGVRVGGRCGARARCPLHRRLPAVLVGRPRGAHARRAALSLAFITASCVSQRVHADRHPIARHAPPSQTRRHCNAPPITTATPQARHKAPAAPHAASAPHPPRSPRLCDMETSTFAAMLLLFMAPLLAAANWQENVRPKMFVQLGRKTYPPPIHPYLPPHPYPP